MSVAHRCRENFSSDIKARGQNYFAEGRVELVSVNDNIWNFSVRGQSESVYAVTLAYSRSFTSLEAKCDCPYYEGGLLCKHIWASLLKADAEGLEKQIPGEHRLFVLHASEDDEEEDETPTEIEEQVFSQYRDEPSWQRRLDLLKSPLLSTTRNDSYRDEHRPQAQAEVWYVLNPEKNISDQLTLNLFQRERLFSGAWGKVRDLRITLREIDKLPNADDREILSFLIGINPEGPEHFPYHSCTMTPPLYEMVLPKLCATQRFIFEKRGRFRVEEVIPLQTRDWRPWSFGMEWKSLKEAWALDAVFYRDSEKLNLTDVSLLTPDIFVYKNEIFILEAKEHWNWLSEVKKNGSIIVEKDDVESFIAELVKIPNLPISNWPENISWSQIKEHPNQVRLSFKPVHTFDYQKYKYDLNFCYGDKVIGQKNPSSVILDIPNKTMIQRDGAYEADIVQTLETLTGGTREISVHDLPKVANRGIELGWFVDVSGQKMRAQAPIHIEVSSGIDWFDVKVTGGVEGGSFDLPTLLSDIQAGKNVVRLGDGTVGVLPEEWLKRLKIIDRLGKNVQGSFQVKKNQATLLDSILADAPLVQGDDFFNEVRNKIQSFDGIKPAKPSKAFKGELRDYQKVGLGWLEFLLEFGFGGCLADDMGLGKTVQILAHLEKQYKEKDLKPTLIVVPKSLVYNWMEEIQRFAPHLKVLVYGGADRPAKFAKFKDHQIIITTYSILRIDIERLVKFEFERVILDEAQNIKNSTSQAARAARSLTARHRLALTGTPVENHLGELWSIFEFLNPGILGSAPLFMDLVQNGTEVNAETAKIFQKALKPFILRRTKENVLKELPQKTEQVLFCDLEPDQQKYYDELRVFYQGSLQKTIDEEGLAKSKIHVLEALLRLRQTACHPALVDKARSVEESGKLKLLLEKIEELLEEKDHKILVFSQFTSLLSLVQDRLKKRRISYEYLDGQTKDRKASVDRFQKDNSKSRIFLISLKAGGVGLNLTKADYVFILDPWWNPAVESQAIDRAHRIGQTKPVFAYRIIAKNTVEEKILQLQSQKRKLVEDLFSGVETNLKTLKADEIQFLLS